MMEREILSRRLWHETPDGRVDLDQTQLLNRSGLVILGEAGMGKTELMRWLAKPVGYKFCTARQLINRYDARDLLGDAQVLVIDALDEVGAKTDGEAVDLVLRKLGALGYPRFILSCRVADWRSATGLQAIREQYGGEPLELHLKPFEEEESVAFLQQRLGLDRAREVVQHFQERGVSDLLGNPQTLQMIERVAEEGRLPESTGELFERFVDLAWVEHNDRRTDTALQALGKDAVLDALGAAFAAMILAGSEALSRLARPSVPAGDLPVADAATLSGAEALPTILDSRLIQATGADRFSYPHRRIGEYLGARWLVRQADTLRKRRRLLALFHAQNLVPASLRGIHAWLARHSNELAPEVIARDPMGVIEYGDADVLTVKQARALIASLEALGARNPRFRDWGPYSLRGIVQPDLIEDLRRLITTPGTPFGLRLLVLEAMAGSTMSAHLAGELRRLLLDPDAVFAERSAAGEALTKVNAGEDWPALLEAIRSLADADSVRLALELLGAVGFDAFSDQQIVEIVCAQAGVSICEVPRSARDRMAGLFIGLKRKLPDQRLDGVLDTLSDYATALVDRQHHRYEDFTDVALELIARRVKLGSVDPRRLWRWLQPFDGEAGYDQRARDSLAEALKADDELRRGVQRHVLLELPGDENVWQRTLRLSRRSTGFAATGQDVVALLTTLDPGNRQDERWRELLSLATHSETEGAQVRAAARLFAVHRADLLEWLDRLPEPHVPEWQVRWELRQRKEAARRAAKWQADRVHFSNRIEVMQMGDFETLIGPANAYLKQFPDIGGDLPAHEQVAVWLGPEVAQAAHQGLEAFLWRDPVQPTAQQMADGFAKGTHWLAGYIIVAALAERLRTGKGFVDLPSEAVISGLYELQHNRIDSHAGVGNLFDALKEEVRRRGLWKVAMRGWFEPQLQRRKDSIDGFHELLHEDHDEALGADLAAEWLDCYSDIASRPEAEMIDRLIRSGRTEALRRIGAARRTSGGLDAERRRNWDVVELLVDFEAAKARLDAPDSPERELLWQLRARLGDRHRDNAPIALSAAQIAWIVRSFRTRWPLARRPAGLTIGNTNNWDASDYLFDLIRRLGNDTSEEGIAHLAALRGAASDGYTESLRIITAEQEQKRVEEGYSPVTLEQLRRVVEGAAPATAADLQATMLEELEQVQAKITSDDVDSRRGFFDGDSPFGEERCRDYLIGLLRQDCEGITLAPEVHVAGDKEVDIGCTVGKVRVPIEVKGQWNDSLWHAADTQLARLYSSDWQAEQRGIYLVLWFGGAGKPLKAPPRGTPRPTTPQELREALIAHSTAAQDRRVEIVVLDLTC